VAAALALRQASAGARIVACDRGRPREAEAAAERLARAAVEVHLETDGTELLAAAERPRTVVKSPGVPAGAPVVARACEEEIEVVGELELGWRLLPNDFCAVTGTNGKTTTVELIGAIHREAGLPVAVAGNVGTPVCAYVGDVAWDATLACEASSFQLEDTSSFAPEVGVFLNFAEDHRDRHPGPADYLAAKLQLFERQEETDFAVLNASEPALARREIGGKARQVWFGESEGCELRHSGGRLEWRGNHLMDASELGLRGPHNLENAMAAAAATLVRGIDADPVRAALRSFRGVPHRLETVAEIGGVRYVNDSKATNVAAAAAALRSFERGVHAIFGGSSKGSGFATLAPAVAERCAACYLIGEAAGRLAEALAPTGVELVSCGDLERAVAQASQRARAGETVLLAPACASFDQYEDFERRGEHFRSLVERLRERNAGGRH
jgi:UDP-N-acetylmuramoylalanine--D-glutamate ligase